MRGQNMRKIVRILMIGIITVFCIMMGIYTRKQNAICVTQIQTHLEESLSYMLETRNHQIIMIDGGSYEDSQQLEKILLEKGGIVEAWFVTLAHSQNFGALQKIIQNNKVQINHIYVSFNHREWYQTYEPDRYAEIAEFFDLLYGENVASKVQDVPNRFEILVDNLYVTTLHVKNPDFTGEYAGFNQSMVIKVNNTYKSMIFMGNIANEMAHHFKDNNLDEIDCDAVQISNNGQQKVDFEIYQKMTPHDLFMSLPQSAEETKNHLQDLKTSLKAKQMYASCDGDITVKIW